MEEEYKRLIDDIREGYFLIQEGKIVLASNYIVEYSGYSRDEVIGETFLKLIATEERERISEFYQKRVAGQEAPQRYETVLLTKGGIRIPSEITAWLTHFQGRPAIAGIAMDIAERKDIMEKLLDSEERYRNIVENSPDIIYTADTEGTILTVNKAVKSVIGYDPEELVGTKFMDLIPENALPLVLEDHYQLCDGNRVESEISTTRKDGVERYFELRSVPFFKDGLVIKAQGVIRDITDRKRAEEKLNRMFESMTDGVTVTDLYGVIIELNEKTAELHGYTSRDELLGKSIFELIAQCDRDRAVENMQKTMELELIRDVEYSLLRQDGSEFWGELNASILKDVFGKPEGFISITRDITERKIAEEALRESAETEKQLRESKQFYIAEIIRTQENERKNLARALHDETVQELLLTSHRLQDVVLGNHGRLPKRAQRYLEDLRILVENIMAEVRGFSVDLRPGVLDDMGLIPALRWLTKRLTDNGGIDARLIVIGEARRLPSETELTIFRIAQEALSNVRKHACASTVKLTVKFDNRKVDLSISDNGKGFELPNMISQYTREHKMGLTGIAERIHLLDGKYKIESSPGQGTIIKVEIDTTLSSCYQDISTIPSSLPVSSKTPKPRSQS